MSQQPELMLGVLTWWASIYTLPEFIKSACRQNAVQKQESQHWIWKKKSPSGRGTGSDAKLY